MNILNNYQIKDSLYEGHRSMVYRGYRNKDHQPVILKVLKNTYPTPEEVARFKREYEITRDLGNKVSGVIKVYGIESLENSLMMVLEDIGGESLAKLKQQKLLKPGLEEFLRLGLQIVEGLGEIHRHGIIHKNLNPSNITWNPVSSQLRIIDFSIAAVLPQEMVKHTSASALEGTLAYISPEQTGRMNRALDYRTDFYSLGVTFYELLTSQLPFNTQDPIELVHSHMARTPAEPRQLDPGIPGILSDMIMKLVAKNAEDRYQSALGLKCDLEECLEQLTSRGSCRYFPIGRKDWLDKFQVPEKLYGRQKEIETLVEAFERSSRGTTEMMLVTGYAGIGKTSLVQEIYKPIVRKRGYFTRGKFDQLKRHIPYAPLIEAFQELVRQLLTENEAQVHQWKTKILDSVGRNAQVLAEVIPEVELIIGKAEPVPELPPPQTQNRFHQVFQNFIRVFATLDHPLTIFLDDLQWIDLPSLKLIEMFMEGAEGESLFLVGAYRDNEIDPNHPLRYTVNSLIAGGCPIHTVNLPPLGLTEVKQLIAETLHCTPSTTHRLAELCLQKTRGNPFFLKQFLQALYHQQLIRLDRVAMCWRWDLEKIESAGITENVVDLLVEKIRQIPPKTQHALKMAAAIGDRFSLKILALVTQQTYQETGDNLWQALQENFITPTDDRYKYAIVADQTGFKSITGLAEFKFTHDRIQEAAYSLIGPEKRVEIHGKIGYLMLEKLSKEKQEEKLFDIVKHLDAGLHLINQPPEMIRLAALNLAAARKAKAAIAYSSALEYIETGTQLLRELPVDAWQDHYRLTFDSYKEQAEIEYLNGNFHRAQDLIDLILEKAHTNVEQAELYRLLIVMYTLQADYEQAIEVGRYALELFGIFLPVENLEKEILQLNARLQKKLQGRSIATLLEEPEMINPGKRAALKLLCTLGPLCYLSNYKLMALTAMEMVDLALDHGQAPELGYAYVTYGMVIVTYGGDYPLAYQLGQAALAVSERFRDLSMKCQASLIFDASINHWVKPIKEGNAINAEGSRAGQDSGELQYTGYLCLYKNLHGCYQGKPLETLLEDIPQDLLYCRKTGNQWSIDALLGIRLVLNNLQGKTPGLLDFDAEDVTEEQYLEQCSHHRSFFAVAAYMILKAQVLYLYGYFDKAAENLERAKELAIYVETCIPETDINVYESLILLARYPPPVKKQEKKWWEQVSSNQKKLKTWADNCPANFLPKYLLVEAEMARVKGKTAEAMKLYEQALESARENGFVQYEALANELAARFYLNLGVIKIARHHVTDALYSYRRWGAVRKFRDLAEKYPHLLPPGMEKREPLSPPGEEKSLLSALSPGKEKGQTETSPYIFDNLAFIKASQILADEIFLEKLLKKMMGIVLENSGAEKGIFLLEKDGNLVIEAMGLVTDPEITVMPSIPLKKLRPVNLSALLSQGILEYVTRTRETVILSDAAHETQFSHDSYIMVQKPRSVLCMPLFHQDRLIGVLYLENNLICGAFTADRVHILDLLSSQMATSIENARIHDRLEKLVENRTAELTSSYEQLRKEIVERRKNEESLKASEEKFATVFRHSPSLMAISGIADGRLVEANQTFAQVLGYRREELIGRTTLELNLWVNPSQRQRLLEEFQLRQEVHNLEVEVRKKSGESCFTLMSGAIIHLDGEPHLLTIAIDITDRKKLEEQLHTAAITDELTGLYNRRGFFTLAEQQFKLANRTKRHMSLLYLDLDNMKAINDRYGHQTGDEALQDTARILKQTFRQSDIIGRIGGDEFAVLLTEHTEFDIEALISEHIHRNVYLHNRETGRKYYLSLSIGIVQYTPEFPLSFSDLLIMADAAMYKDKKQRKLYAFNEKLKKRRYKRYEVYNRWSTLDGREKVEIKNISMGGLCLRTSEPLAVNTLYHIDLPAVIDGEAAMKGSVVWSLSRKENTREEGQEPHYEAGVKFLKLKPHQKHPIKKFLRSLVH